LKFFNELAFLSEMREGIFEVMLFGDCSIGSRGNENKYGSGIPHTRVFTPPPAIEWGEMQRLPVVLKGEPGAPTLQRGKGYSLSGAQLAAQHAGKANKSGAEQ